MVSPFPVIALGHGKIEMGDGIHDGRLPALWFGNNGQGMGVERVRNSYASEGETLAVVTFEGVEGLDVLLNVIHRIRRLSFPEAAPTNLSAVILALPCKPPKFANRVNTLAYSEGHEDARRTAAELAASQSSAVPQAASDDRLYKVALAALKTLRGCAATYVEDHSKDTYPGSPGLRPQDVANMWAQEIHAIDAKVFLDEAIADAGIAAVPQAVAVPAWISVDERLPKDGEDVIALYYPYGNEQNSRIAQQARHNDGTFYVDDDAEMHTPTHWMLLPDAPAVANGDAA